MLAAVSCYSHYSHYIFNNDTKLLVDIFALDVKILLNSNKKLILHDNDARKCFTFTSGTGKIFLINTLQKVTFETRIICSQGSLLLRRFGSFAWNLVISPILEKNLWFWPHPCIVMIIYKEEANLVTFWFGGISWVWRNSMPAKVERTLSIVFYDL